MSASHLPKKSPTRKPLPLKGRKQAHSKKKKSVPSDSESSDEGDEVDEGGRHLLKSQRKWRKERLDKYPYGEYPLFRKPYFMRHKPFAKQCSLDLDYSDEASHISGLVFNENKSLKEHDELGALIKDVHAERLLKRNNCIATEEHTDEVPGEFVGGFLDALFLQDIIIIEEQQNMACALESFRGTYS